MNKFEQVSSLHQMSLAGVGGYIQGRVGLGYVLGVGYVRGRLCAGGQGMSAGVGGWGMFRGG